MMDDINRRFDAEIITETTDRPLHNEGWTFDDAKIASHQSFPTTFETR